MALPKRWLKCPRKGQLIAEKFIPFKTPLDMKFDSQIPEANRWNIPMLFKGLQPYKLKMGLIIDLTNSNRFYDKQTLDEYDCKYLKIACVGHDETPTPENVNLFTTTCRTFFRNFPLQVIGIHCTHGFNRTGFLIIQFLVTELNWPVEDSITYFAKARPPGIYKQHYIDELFCLLGDATDTFSAPPLPAWCNEADDETHDHPVSQYPSRQLMSNGAAREISSAAAPYRPPVQKTQVQTSQFAVPGLPGVTPIVAEPLVSEIQRKVQAMCGWTRAGFPGSQPVSMDLTNVRFLERRPYKVSWKADGTRYLMLIDGVDRVYLIDRDNSVFYVAGLVFPDRKSASGAVLENTLADGELVVDEVMEASGERRRVVNFLLYDIVRFKQAPGSKADVPVVYRIQSFCSLTAVLRILTRPCVSHAEKQDAPVGSCIFSIRLLCIQKELIAPREALDRSADPFRIVKKDFWELADARKILDEKFSKQVKHEVDGLIFQPSKDAYHPGRTDTVLKWKPPELNSVDFRLKIVKTSGQGMLTETWAYLYVGQNNEPFGRMRPTKELRALNDKIIECSWDFNTNGWKFLRQRTDKSFPNALTTAQAVCASISNPVTKDILFGLIDKIKARPAAPQQQQQQLKQPQPKPSLSAQQDPRLQKVDAIQAQPADPFRRPSLPAPRALRSPTEPNSISTADKPSSTNADGPSVNVVDRPVDNVGDIPSSNTTDRLFDNAADRTCDNATDRTGVNTANITAVSDSNSSMTASESSDGVSSDDDGGNPLDGLDDDDGGGGASNDEANPDDGGNPLDGLDDGGGGASNDETNHNDGDTQDMMVYAEDGAPSRTEPSSDMPDGDTQDAMVYAEDATIYDDNEVGDESDALRHEDDEELDDEIDSPNDYDDAYGVSRKRKAQPSLTELMEKRSR